MVARSASYARGISAESDLNITDTMIAIIEDDPQMRPHPQPMVNRKIVNRVPNCAELFDQLHQADYESHEHQTNNYMKRVRLHNQSYPVMYDELNRKRSMTRMSTTNIRAHTSNRNYRNDWKYRNKKRLKGGRISKYRKLFMSHKACQYEIPQPNYMIGEIVENVPECSKKISQERQIDDLPKGLVDIDHDNIKPSVSSYNSVITLTNEPMVEKLYYYSPKPSKTLN